MCIFEKTLLAFQFVIRMFGAILMPTRIGHGFRSRVPGVGPSSKPKVQKFVPAHFAPRLRLIDVFLDKK